MTIEIRLTGLVRTAAEHAERLEALLVMPTPDAISHCEEQVLATEHCLRDLVSALADNLLDEAPEEDRVALREGLEKLAMQLQRAKLLLQQIQEHSVDALAELQRATTTGYGRQGQPSLSLTFRSRLAVQG